MSSTTAQAESAVAATASVVATPHRTRTLSIAGQEYHPLAWTVGEREKYMEELKGFTTLVGTEAIQAYDRFLAEQLQISIEAVKSIDAIAYDQLGAEIVKANVTFTTPKAPETPSPQQSSSETIPA